MRKELSADEILRLLSLVSDELMSREQKATIYLVGGANIALVVDAACTTNDIDAAIKRGYTEVTAAAQAVAEREPDLAADWLNAEFTAGEGQTGGLSRQWFDNRDADKPQTVFASDALTVELASPEMMLALKTLAGRYQDLNDAFALMRLTGLRTYAELSRNIERFTGRRLFESQGKPTTFIDVRHSIRRILDNAPEDLRPPPKTRLTDRLRNRFSRH